MLAADRRDLDAAEHARQFFDAGIPVESHDAASDLPAVDALDHLPLPVGASSHLRQMRNAQHLPLAAEFIEQAPDDLGNRAADTDIDLVENQRWNARRLAGHHLDGQADARQFAAGSDFRQRARFAARQ